MWAENKVISVPCLAEEEEEEEGPEGLWSSLFMDSALGNVDALLKIWEKKFGSKGCRFGSPSQAGTAEMQKSLHLSMEQHTEGLPEVPHSSCSQTLASCALPWDLPCSQPCQQHLGRGRVRISSLPPPW